MGRITVDAKTEEMSVLSCETHDGYDVSFLVGFFLVETKASSN